MSRNARGQFLPGPDPDRHALTRAERRRGYRHAVRKLAAVLGPWDATAWVYYRVRGYYRSRNREEGSR